MYSLMDQVPAIMHTLVGSVTPAAMAQALMSNMPPMTGVPAFRPHFAAASSVTKPQISVAWQSGGRASFTSGMPYISRSASSKLTVHRFMSPEPE